ncbi:hypothetical protein GOODEAATRI_005103, partial [Goodea atripinnis]
TTEVRQCRVAATGRCVGGSCRCGKEGYGEWDLSPARYWKNLEPSAVSSSTSLTGCPLSLAWQAGAPTAQSRWMGSTCGRQSG